MAGSWELLCAYPTLPEGCLVRSEVYCHGILDSCSAVAWVDGLDAAACLLEIRGRSVGWQLSPDLLLCSSAVAPCIQKSFEGGVR